MTGPEYPDETGPIPTPDRPISRMERRARRSRGSDPQSSGPERSTQETPPAPADRPTHAAPMPGQGSASAEGGTAGHSSSKIARSSLVLASGTIASRLLGFVRVSLLAATLGLLETPAGNAWQTANTLPNTVYLILAGGILSVVFVPALTRAMARDDGGRDFSDRLITLALASLLGITIVVTLFAGLLTQLYALSWSGPQLALAVAFAYLCLPQIFFYGLYTVLGQVLNSMEKWGWYTWAPVANNIVAIGGLILFMVMYPDAGSMNVADWTGAMIWWLGGTATLGVATQGLVLIWPLWRSGFRWRPRWGFRGVGLGATSRMAMWTLGVIAVSQFGMWVSTNLLNRASEMDPGAPGRFIYETAFLFFILPHSIVTYSLVTAMFTQLSRTAARDDYASLREQWDQGSRLLGVTMIPISIGMVLMIPAITTVLLPGNTLDETLATAFVSMPLLAGLAPYAFYTFASRVFFAFQDGKTPFLMQLIISGISLALLVVVYSLPANVAAFGISAAQSLGQVGAAVAAIWLVKRALRGFSYTAVARTWSRALLASLVAALPAAALGGALIWLIDGRIAYLLALLMAGPIFFATYFFIASKLGIQELRDAAAPVLRRLNRRSRLGLAAQGASPAAVTQQDEALSGETAAPGSTPAAADWEPESAATQQQGEPLDGDALAPTSSIRKDSALHGITAGTTLGKRYVLEDLLAQRDDDLDYWSARDTTLDRLVAVTIVPATGAHEQMAHNVQDGARRTAGVDDGRLVRVLDMGIDDGICWIVEEGLAEALSLAALVEDGPLPAEEARRIIGEGASGMEAARRRGLHHLFLSPHALLRTIEGNIKVSGVAVAAAIEQVDDIGSAEASIIDTNDLVSLLYTALTGYWPGEEMEGLASARRLADGSLPAPSELVEGVPGDLDALCRQVLAEDYDPRTGPRTPGQLAQQLSPWSPEMVRGSGGARRRSADPGPGPDSAEDPDDITDSHDARPTYYRTAGVAGGAGAAGAVAATSGAGPDDFDGAAFVDEQDDFDVDHVDDGTVPEEGYYAGSAEGARRNTASTLIVLLLVLAVVGAAVFFGLRILGGDNEPEEAAPPPPPVATDEPADEATETDEPEEEEEEEEPLWTLGDTLDPVEARPFDSVGQAERIDVVHHVLDGDPDTAWVTFTYFSPNWGSLKSGVGLSIDLGESTPVGEVTVTFPIGDNGATIYVTDEVVTNDSQLDGLTELGSSDDASGEWTVTADEEEAPPEGRYVIVWFDRAWQGPEGEQVTVSEVEVVEAEEQ